MSAASRLTHSPSGVTCAHSLLALGTSYLLGGIAAAGVTENQHWEAWRAVHLSPESHTTVGPWDCYGQGKHSASIPAYLHIRRREFQRPAISIFLK